MCGQYDALLYLTQILLGFNIKPGLYEHSQLAKRVAPTDGAPILIQNPENGAVEIIPARFGLIPHWYAKSVKDWKATTFNARLDTAGTLPVFRGAWTYRHCIVPAEAFYEWSGPKNARQKWRITRGDNQPLGFAGLWDCASLPEGEIWSFTILTRDAGPDMTAVHTREPVILHPDQWEDWLRLKPVGLRRPSPLTLTAA